MMTHQKETCLEQQEQQNRIMDDVCIAAAMRLQPYVCFEQCRQGWKESPINVKRKGVLHDSWKTFTSLVRLLEMSREGMYMHTHLERVCKGEVLDLTPGFGLFSIYL